jgi:hypothetical protein
LSPWEAVGDWLFKKRVYKEYKERKIQLTFAKDNGCESFRGSLCGGGDEE